MLNNLSETIKKDLDNYSLNKKQELIGYTRWLLSEAYFCKDGDTNTHKYAKQKGRSIIDKEIRNMVYKGDNFLVYDKLFYTAAEAIVSNYLKSNIQSFNEVMQKTLSYYSDSFNPKDKNEVIWFAKEILSKYFYENNLLVFSSKNGTRAYVSEKSPSQFLNEMKKELNMISSVPEAIIGIYANKVASDWIYKQNDIALNKENDLNDVISLIINEINKVNINDSLKTYLINEFQNNPDILQRYIPDELINEYKKLSSSLNLGTHLN